MTGIINRALHVFDSPPGMDPSSEAYPDAAAITTTEPRSTTNRALIRELLELDHIIARTPLFMKCPDGAVNISESFRELLARRRRIIGELRLRRLIHRGTSMTRQGISVSGPATTGGAHRARLTKGASSGEN